MQKEDPPVVSKDRNSDCQHRRQDLGLTSLWPLGSGPGVEESAPRAAQSTLSVPFTPAPPVTLVWKWAQNPPFLLKLSGYQMWHDSEFLFRKGRAHVHPVGEFDGVDSEDIVTVT